MSVSTDVTQIDYLGGGLNVDFPTTFPFQNNSEIVVSLAPESAGVTPDDADFAVLTLGVDYTVSGAGEDAGGTVTMVVAPEPDSTVRLSRTVSLVQPTSFRTQGSFSPKVHERSFDKLTMIAQQLQRNVDENQQTLTDALAEIASSDLVGSPFGFLTLQAPVTPSNALQVRFRSNGTRVQLSEYGARYRGVVGGSRTFDVKDGTTGDTGAAGNNVTDDTAEIQAIFTALSESGFTGNVARVLFPLSNGIATRYRITKPIRYQANTSSALRVMGEIAARGDSGVQITWDGPALVHVAVGAMVRTSNVVRVTIPSHTYVVGDHIINGHTESTFYAGLKVVTAIGGSGASAWVEYSETGANATSAEVHAFGQAMFEFLGVNSSIFEHIQLQGREKTITNIWIRKTSASIFFDHVVCSGVAYSPYSAPWFIGDPQDTGGTYQTSEVFFSRCEGGGLGGGAVVRVLSAGNTKNFHFKDCIFNYAINIIDHPGEGVVTIDGLISLNAAGCTVKLGSSRAILHGVECEDAIWVNWTATTSYLKGFSLVRNGGKGYQCLVPGVSAGSGGPTGTGLSITDGSVVWMYIGDDGSRFVKGGAASVSSAIIMDACSWDGSAPSDDVVVQVSSPLFMRGCFFANSRTGGAIPWIQVNGLLRTPNRNAVTGGDTVATIISECNTFYNATDVAPFRDSGGNLVQATIAPSGAYPLLVPHSVKSKGDMGGTSGSLNALREFEGAPPSYATLVCPQNVISGVTVQEIGQPGSGWNRVTISYTALQAAALTKDLTVFVPLARTRICAMYVDAKTAMAGPAGTLLLRVGSSSGGQEYIKDVNVKTIANYPASGDLGTAFTGTSFLFNGYIVDWNNPSSIYVRLTSSSGNLSGLTAGSVDIILKTERVPGKYS